MRGRTPEFFAIPVVIVLLGLVFVIMFVLDAGLVAMALAAVAIVAVAVVAMRRPRGSVLSEDSAEFKGGAEPADDGVHRVMLVVDSSCAAHDLEGLPVGRDREGTAVFVVVPAVSSRLARWTGDEQAYSDANDHLDLTIQALTELGLQATGRVGAHDPLQATDEALREFPANEIAFVLHGSSEAEWLEHGVVEMARARYTVPVRELAMLKRE